MASKKIREQVYAKFGGLCGYTGTPLESDWQIDHIEPVIRRPGIGTVFENRDVIENMIPTQKIINHYKRNWSLSQFRNWILKDLHIRLKKKPKNPKTEKSRKQKEYLFKVASYFGITEEIPFSGKFYFEK
jgi:hypothetical protein